MKRKLTTVFFLGAVLAACLVTPVFAITEADVEAQVSSVGREAVTGNVLIWFLCAVAFLKVSQKIDSFISSLGISVGRTGGSMLAEAMIVIRGASMIAGAMGHSLAGARRSSGGPSSASSPTGGAGFFNGGLIGMAGRHITNSAVKTATTQTSAVHTAYNPTNQSVSDAQINSEIHSGSLSDHVENNISAEASSQESVAVTGGDTSIHMTQAGNPTASGPAPAAGTADTGSGKDAPSSSTFMRGGVMPTLGGTVFSHSLASGGSFANDVIGTVARGEVAGSITGDLAAQSLTSYMGYTSSGAGAPSYSDVEIGWGRITGVETSEGSSEGRAFAMYHATQYIAPSGEYSKVCSADGTQWYKQYAQDTVERKPYMAPDDTVAYHEKIVKKLPSPPKRKDRI